jgi:general secretion pathway protein G
MRAPGPHPRGFTLIELLVVMAALGLLLAVVAPQYVQHVDRARETALRQNLASLRDVIDKYHADHARYPVTLNELVAGHYLRSLPVDPLTERSDTWVLVAPNGQVGVAAGTPIFDVRSGAPGRAKDGSLYASW